MCDRSKEEREVVRQKHLAAARVTQLLRHTVLSRLGFTNIERTAISFAITTKRLEDTRERMQQAIDEDTKRKGECDG